ncbi:MAG: hypothetical protein AAB460_03135 [Patescibacteria group bacterium]
MKPRNKKLLLGNVLLILAGIAILIQLGVIVMCFGEYLIGNPQGHPNFGPAGCMLIPIFGFMDFWQLYLFVAGIFALGFFLRVGGIVNSPKQIK